MRAEEPSDSRSHCEPVLIRYRYKESSECSLLKPHTSIPKLSVKMCKTVPLGVNQLVTGAVPSKVQMLYLHYGRFSVINFSMPTVRDAGL